MEHFKHLPSPNAVSRAIRVLVKASDGQTWVIFSLHFGKYFWSHDEMCFCTGLGCSWTVIFNILLHKLPERLKNSPLTQVPFECSTQGSKGVSW